MNGIIWKQPRMFVWLGLSLVLLLSGTMFGCDCGSPPGRLDGTGQFDGGVIRPDVTVTDAPDEQGPEEQIDTDPPCFSLGTPCGANGSCNPSCSGQELNCQEGICQLPEQPDQPPPDQQCPARCRRHDDCRAVPACGERRDCVNGVCSIPAVPCPRTCRSDSDCQTPLCGSRIRCNAGICDTLPQCPQGCTEDADCAIQSCGARNQCLNGVCAEPPKNDAPTAVAEQSQKVEVGNRVQLDGSKSSDPDNDPLTFRWSFIKKPAGSLTDFDDASAEKPAFVPDRPGDYQIALIVNDGKVDSKPASVTITATNQANPAPVLATFSPKDLQEGSSNLTVRIFGLNFQSGAKLSFNNLLLNTTFVNNTELTVTLPQGLSAGSYPVFVQNPDNQKSRTLNYNIIKKPNDPPVLRQISPVEVDAGQAFQLNLFGEKFLTGAEVLINTTTFNATVVNNGRSMSASITALAAGIYNVQVSNPDGQKSAVLTLRVVTVKKGPVLTTISPNSVFAGQTFLLVLNGDRFQQGAKVTIGTQTYQSVFGSDKILRVANVTLATPGNIPVEVENPGGLKSNRVVIEVKQRLSKPIITLLRPSSVTEKTAVTIAVQGNDFANGATVSVDGKAYPTSFVSVGELRVTLPNTLTVGTYAVQVENPDKQTSNSLNLTVTQAPPKPVVTSINPSRVPSGSTNTIVVTGSNFVSGAQVQVGARLVTTTFGSATELKASLPSLPPGTYDVRVFNPGNQVSNSVKLEVFQAPAPVISSLVPNKGTSGSVLTVRVLGKNFTQQSSVLFQGGAQPTTYVSATELTVTLSLNSLNPATYQLWVRNADGQVSNKVPFIVEAPQGPQITSLLPSEGQTNTTVSLIVNGARFSTGAVVNFNGKQIKTTFLNASTLGVSLDLNGVAAGTYPLSVTNADKKDSNIVYFTVQAQKLPAPVITQIKPSSIKISSAGASNPVYILGRNFQNGALLSFQLPFVGSIGLPTNFINSQTLVMTAQFPRIPFPFPAQRTNAFVTNPDKQTSNRVQVTVQP
ncbi:MAG: hypothetical protein EP343_23860 [Deltaproteobacteria bacterium]|nr:MAG: hypothetical protein EP343_23860 [Deltaproteobacteria bacterium]